MLISSQNQRGFSLIELMVGVVILLIVTALGMPSYRAWIQNTKIRNAAESILNGLQLARAEAVRRNTPVQFQLRTGSAWTVCLQPSPAGPCPNPDNGTTIQSRAANEGASAAITVTPTPAAATIAIFDNFGRISTGTVPFSQLDVDIDPAVLPAADSRNLRVIIAMGGNARMCDPEPSLSASDPRKCP